MAERNCYIYRIQPVRPAMLSEGSTEEEAQIVDAHFEYLRSLTEQGIVMLAGRALATEYASFGVVLFCAETPEIAQRIVDDDPAVYHRVMRAELFPFRLSLLGNLQAC
jgi:uncharacterized protein YciI